MYVDQWSGSGHTASKRHPCAIWPSLISSFTLNTKSQAPVTKMTSPWSSWRKRSHSQKRLPRWGCRTPLTPSAHPPIAGSPAGGTWGPTVRPPPLPQRSDVSSSSSFHAACLHSSVAESWNPSAAPASHCPSECVQGEVSWADWQHAVCRRHEWREGPLQSEYWAKGPLVELHL